jgi:hypothetical protein
VENNRSDKKFWNRWRIGLILSFVAFFVVQVIKTGGFDHRANYYDEYTIWRPPKDLIVNDENYEKTLSFARQRHYILSQQYTSPVSENTSFLIEREAMRFFSQFLYDSLSPYWLGTTFSKTGKSEIPGKGVISPENFVLQLLKDMGVDMRIDPELIYKPGDLIEFLLFNRNISHYYGTPMASFIQDVKDKSDGLYLLALDEHIGFLNVEGENLSFLHVAPKKPFCVVIEDAEKSKLIAQSKDRWLGLISDAEEFIRHWLENEPIIMESIKISNPDTASSSDSTVQ